MPTNDDHATADDASPEDTSTSSDGHAAVAGFESTDTPLEPFGEVISGAMDPHDPDATNELDLPGDDENLNPHPAEADPGFDGWLDDNEIPAKAEDPYSSLSEPEDEDDDATEIADWMAFTSSASDDPPVSEDVEVVVDVTDTAIADDAGSGAEASESVGDDLVEEDVPSVQVTESEDDDPSEDTVEILLTDTDSEGDDVDDAEPLSSDADDPSGEDEIESVDPEKLAVLPVVPIGVAATLNEDSSDADTGDPADTDDDTGEIPIIGVASSEAGSDSGSSVFDIEDFTEEHYLDAATREHHDLAAAVAVAESESTEQVALSAAIPGLDSGVVGFDDVVDSQGDESTAPIAPPKSSDLVLRVGTGVVLVAAFLLSLLWRPALIVLALAVFVIAAGEFYSVLMHRRYKPLSIFGFLGIVGAGLGAVVWGVVAIPLAFALMITVILLFDAVSQRRQGAVSGFALTILVAVWVGGFGAFAFPIIAADDYQALVLTIVGMVALVDIAAYFVGRTIGSRPFAPTISPKKTIEGFIGGTLMAFLAGAVASFFIGAIDLPAGLVLGAVVAVFAPLGDLSVSVVKRSLNIKDMGSILPGHGGLLDRIDAIIAVIPAAWATFAWLGLL